MGRITIAAALLCTLAACGESAVSPVNAQGEAGASLQESFDASPRAGESGDASALLDVEEHADAGNDGPDAGDALDAPDSASRPAPDREVPQGDATDAISHGDDVEGASGDSEVAIEDDVQSSDGASLNDDATGLSEDASIEVVDTEPGPPDHGALIDDSDEPSSDIESASEDVAALDVGPIDDAQVDPCEACLASGGTWQPEANACTANCDIMDISCYSSSCPAPCAPESCSTCIGSEECEAAGCQWNAQPPAFWCTEPWD